jgi:hypothetical protein
MLTPHQAIIVSRFLILFAPHKNEGAMSQKPIAMEQLKQILQLKNDGVGIREIARRTSMSRNSVRKYLALLDLNEADTAEPLSNKAIADKAYHNDQLDMMQTGCISCLFILPMQKLNWQRPVSPVCCSGMSICGNIRMVTSTVITAFILINICAIKRYPCIWNTNLAM